MVVGLVPPGEHEVLVLLCEIVALLGTAKALGWVAGRAGQPAVIGELISGLILGPSVLGAIAPGAHDWLFPADEVQGAALYALAWLGLLLLLATTGFESDLRVIVTIGRPALLVATGSLLLPLAGGALLGAAIPEGLRGPRATATTFAALMAVALSISSLPVVAKVLAELGLVRRSIGQLILAVAMTNDVVGWILLGVVAGLAQEGSVDGTDVAIRVAGIFAFLAAALTIGQRLVDRALRETSNSSLPPTGPAAVVVLVVLAAGALTQWMGVEAVLGAFVAGIVVGRSRWRDERVIRLVEDFGAGLLSPLFFATAGLRVDLGVFIDATVALWALVVIAVASITKLAGAVIGARLGGLPRREQFAAGVALNARGALEIVIASVGVSIGVLNDESYGVIVLMALVTSIAAPPLLRMLLADWPGDPGEQERLAREAAERSRLVISNRPPLLLTRGGPPSIVAAQLIDLAWPDDTPVTAIVPPEAGAELDVISGIFSDRKLGQIRLPSGPGFADAVLSVADRSHSAIVLALTDRPGEDPLPPLARAIVAGASVPVILVRRERITGRALPPAFGSAVIPVAGSTASNAAIELGAQLSARLGTQLRLIHVDPTPHLPFMNLTPERAMSPGRALLAAAAAAARLGGAADVATLSRNAESPPAEILGLTVELEADLLIVGTIRRDTAAGPQLGPTAAHALATCPATVIVVALPPGWSGPDRH